MDKLEFAETKESFLAECGQFKLGSLVTESPNPITTGLAEACQSNLPNALQMLQLADVHALQTLARGSQEAMPKIRALAAAIHETLESGHCVFFEGCGATGRLSLTIEVLAREGLVDDKYRDQIKGFMAGGDAALIRSIEQFEDRRDFGARQLADLGFVDGDLCVAITEGGETTFVIAAVEEAVRLSEKTQHWFLYCNPDDVLAPAAERSANVLQNPRIEKINLTCGPMAVTGSTRMQATTIQLLVAGLCVQHHADPAAIEPAIAAFAAFHATVDYADFAPITAAEAKLYEHKIPFMYHTDYFTCTVLTDTTERAPTFSLPSFENFAASPPEPPTPVYLQLPGTRSAHDAWQRLLRREPRGIAWDAVYQKTGNRAIYGYDFSEATGACACARRRALLSDALAARTDGGRKLAAKFALVDVGSEKPAISFEVPKVESLLLNEGEVEYVGVRIDVPAAWTQPTTAVRSQIWAADPLMRLAQPLLLNILAKVILNAHSTALMGANRRLRSNVMTFVRPSNKKLIDRAARYVLQLFGETQANFPPAERKATTYEEVVAEIFEQRKTLGPADAIVIRVLDAMLEKTGSKKVPE